MASCRSVKLKIEPGINANKRKVTVNYKLCFTPCEALAGSVFIEKVTLQGDDPILDDHLITLKNSCVKAQSDCIKREIVQQVSKSKLDEDPDTIILGLVLGNKDEIYARVKLTPYSPVKCSSDSDVVKGHFGKASN